MDTSDTTATWRPDPYARAQERFYDGERWTARIRDHGEETTDPLGATATIPFTNPTGITPRLHAVKRSGFGGLVDTVKAGWRRLVHRD